VNWADFLRAAPQIGTLAKEAFEDQHVAILGTIRRDGWPRISPCEVYFVDSEMLLGMMPNSTKVLDLRRDARITVVNGQEHREPRLGDVKLYGRGREIFDATLRERFADAQESLIKVAAARFRPRLRRRHRAPPYISFGQGRRLLRWDPELGEEPLGHPERT